MALKSRSSKLKRRRSLKVPRNISLFPSSLTYSLNSKPGKNKGNRRHRRSRRLCRVNIKRTSFMELPDRRDFRIKQSIDQSIRSHINRLAGYRYTSMMKAADPPCCAIGTCPYSSQSMSTSSPYIHSSINPRRQSMPGIPRRKSRNVRKRQKHLKEEEIRTINPDHNDIPINPLDFDVKKVTEAVKNFEKQRIEFLSSLAKMHAQISSLRILPPEQMKLFENEEKRNEPKIDPQKIKQEIASLNKLKQFNPAIMKTMATNPNLNLLAKRKQLSSPKSKTRKYKGNIMNNLSQLLLHTSQRPISKTDGEDAENISKLPALKSKLQSEGPLQGGLMNLAQTFCSMATGF